MRTVSGLSAILCSLLILIGFGPAATAEAPEDILAVTPYYATGEIAAGSPFTLALQVRLKQGWHVNSNTPSGAFSIPSELVLDAVPGIGIERIVFPPHVVKQLTKTGEKSELFEGTFYVAIHGRADAGLQPGNYAVNGSFRYQGCNEVTCLPPAEKTVAFTLQVVPAGASVKEVNPGIFSNITASGAVVAAGEKADDSISRSIAEKGLLLTLLLIFLGGLALNLTPCVYPLIPITVSYFGSQQHRGKGVLNAAAYVCGIALTYSVLGTVAALTGGMLGSLLTSPVTIVVIAGIMVGLSLSMFGLYEIRVPRFLMNMAGGEARGGALGALIMGLSMGVIAAPCIGPFVIGLLTYVATLGSPVKGFLMFFVLSLGLGLPYLILGLFSSRISSLPRSGEWMIGVKKIFGFILITMAVYFLNPLLSAPWYRILFSGSLFFGGFWLLVIDRSGEGRRGFHAFKAVVAIAMIVAATWFIKPEPEAAARLPWQPYSAEQLAGAREAGTPVVIDFYADWCIPCKELDEFTFTDPRLQKYAGQFIFLKVDLTSDASEQTKRLKQQYAIKGVPTIVFLNPAGAEMAELRLTGFEEAEQFAARLERARGGG
ncbi:MAG: cytochrome c biogenesis protein CcdA [Nitrospirota bacterium]